MDAEYLFKVMYVNGLFENLVDYSAGFLPWDEIERRNREFFEKHKDVFNWLSGYVTRLEEEIIKLELLKKPGYLVCSEGIVKLPVWKELPPDSGKGVYIEGEGIGRKLCANGKYIYLFELEELPNESNKSDKSDEA